MVEVPFLAGLPGAIAVLLVIGRLQSPVAGGFLDNWFPMQSAPAVSLGGPG
jgi:hypothetical protein